jgi:surface protein
MSYLVNGEDITGKLAYFIYDSDSFNTFLTGSDWNNNQQISAVHYHILKENQAVSDLFSDTTKYSNAKIYEYDHLDGAGSKVLLYLVSVTETLTPEELFTSFNGIDFSKEVHGPIPGQVEGEHGGPTTVTVNSMHFVMAYGKEKLSVHAHDDLVKGVNSFDEYFFGSKNANAKLFDSLFFLDLSAFDTSSIENVTNPLGDYTSLKSVKIVNFVGCDFSNLKTFKYVFNGMPALQGVYFTDPSSNKATTISLPELTELSNLFSENNDLNPVCTSLNSLDVSHCSSISNLFESCNSIAYVDLSNWNTSNCDTLSSLFKDCEKLLVVDLYNFTVKAPTTSSDKTSYTSTLIWFCNCPHLKKVFIKNEIDSTHLDPPSYDDIIYGSMSIPTLFDQCYDLPAVKKNGGYLPIAFQVKFEYGYFTKEESPFAMLKRNFLDDIYNKIGGFITSSDSDIKNIVTGLVVEDSNSKYFSGMSSTDIEAKLTTLKAIDVSEPGKSKVMAWVDSDNGSAKSVFSSLANKFNTCTIHLYAYGKPIYLNPDSSSAFNFNRFGTDIEELDLNVFDASLMIKACNFISVSNKGIYEYPHTEGCLGDFRRRAEIHLESLNTECVCNMSRMFAGCNANFDVSNLDTSNATEMSGMFNGSRTDVIDCSGFDTSNVTDMSYMFGWCGSKSIDVSSFDTSNVTDMSHMFGGCYSKSIDVSSFDTRQVTDMSYMFEYCGALQLDTSHFSGKNVKNVSRMFYEATGISYVDLSSFDASPTIAEGMFKGCSAETIKLSNNFDTSKCIDMSNMFNQCYNIKEIKFPKLFTTENVRTMSSMFNHCTSLEKIDISSFSYKNVRSVSSMFEGCSSLKYVDLGYFYPYESFSGVSYMFSGCSSLVKVFVDAKVIKEDSWISESGRFYNPSSNHAFDGCTKLSGGVAFDSSKTGSTMFSGKTGYFTPSLGAKTDIPVPYIIYKGKVIYKNLDTYLDS